VDRVERELLALRPALLGGSIGTFDDVFSRIVEGCGDARRPLASATRALPVRRVVGSVDLRGFAASAARSGFAASLQQALDELEAGLLAPEAVAREVGALYAAYEEELDPASA